jgi:ribosomal protein L35
VDEKSKTKQAMKERFWYTASSRYRARSALVRGAVEKGYSKQNVIETKE